jgi:hypothetical protein
MKIFYRGYVIRRVETPKSGFAVEGRRPARSPVAFENNPRSAMRWVDHDVIRQKVADAGWLTSQMLSA